MAARPVMRGDSHTWITIIAHAVNTWKREQAWSRETVADQIVQSHVNNCSHLVTGITFDMQGSGDEYRRQHTNANKIFRWLDELTKDNNLLPANFIKSILMALPPALRLRAVNTLLLDLELTARPIIKADEPISPLDMLRHILQESGEVTNAYAQLVDGIDPGELELAMETTNKALAALNQSKAVILKMLLEQPAS